MADESGARRADEGDDEGQVREIDAREFARVVASGHDDVTLVDLREPDEVIVSGIDGALNIPFGQIAERIDDIPADKPVYLYCRTGDWSGEVAELLADRGYEVYDLAGGYQAYRALTEGGQGDAAQAAAAAAATKAPEAAPAASTAAPQPAATAASPGEPAFVDAKGLRCPGPIVKVADTLRALPDGAELRVEATEDAFVSDVAVWADRTGNTLESLDVDADGVIHALLRKGAPSGQPQAGAATPAAADADHEKTFVVFSGDLDKTIAAFIMANGGAAMGRQVTMFFTFWGLNILRKPKKVKVKKNLVEKMFGAMMPRGTTKLGLSRMNMLGMGPKMIRWLMREKGISSLEELIDDARSHGVRIVACQMSMDIMGIKKEELIDGVELGGVATMLGSAERSDLTYFI